MPKQPFSTEELALLDAIHCDPRNDRPRLAYADWLETHGLPGFAELIRIQCSEPYFVLTMGRPLALTPKPIGSNLMTPPVPTVPSNCFGRSTTAIAFH